MSPTALERLCTGQIWDFLETPITAPMRWGTYCCCSFKFNPQVEKKFHRTPKKLTHWPAVVAQGFKSSAMYKHSWCLQTRVWTSLEAAQLACHKHTHLHPHPTYPHPSYMILLLCVCYFLVRFSFSFDKERKVWRLFSWSKNDCQKTFCFWKKKVLTFTLELPAIQLGFDYSPKIRLW